MKTQVHSQEERMPVIQRLPLRWWKFTEVWDGIFWLERGQPETLRTIFAREHVVGLPKSVHVVLACHVEYRACRSVHSPPSRRTVFLGGIEGRNHETLITDASQVEYAPLMDT